MSGTIQDGGMSLTEIILKLNGPIHATGEHNADQSRLRNLKNLNETLADLMMEIDSVSECRRNYQASMKAIGEEAHQFFKNTEEWLEGREA